MLHGILHGVSCRNRRFGWLIAGIFLQTHA
jgi:hypothetical protein